MSERIPTVKGPNKANKRVYPKLDDIESGMQFRLDNVTTEKPFEVIGVNRSKGYARIKNCNDGNIERVKGHFFDSVTFE